MKNLGRRKFLKFAGVAAAAEAFFGNLHPALAQTWQKVANPTGAAGTWQKLTVASTTNFIGASAVSGSVQSLKLRSDGLVFSCGNNTYGNLGDNSTVSKSTFVQTLGVSNVVAISSGTYHSLALRADGLVFGVGLNQYGQIGCNTTVSKSTYVQAVGISNIIAVGAGQKFSAVLRSDGLVFSVGMNWGGQLGDNTANDSSTFVQALGISNAVAVAAGYDFAVALRADGLVFACGYNTNGKLGDNSGLFARSTYVQALGISNAVAVATGKDFAVVLRADGLVYSCGQNLYGQLGDNSNVDKLTYVQALGISNVVAVATGTTFAVALRSDGLVFASGNNVYGQLGDNTVVSKSTFVQATGVSNIIALGATSASPISSVLRSDGVVFACGRNTSGFLGDQTTIDRSTFVQCL